jgi:hypothetical protein
MSKNNHRRKRKAKRKVNRRKQAISLKRRVVKPPKAKKAVKREIKKILLDFSELKI